MSILTETRNAATSIRISRPRFINSVSCSTRRTNLVGKKLGGCCTLPLMVCCCALISKVSISLILQGAFLTVPTQIVRLHSKFHQKSSEFTYRLALLRGGQLKKPPCTKDKDFSRAAFSYFSLPHFQTYLWASHSYRGDSLEQNNLHSSQLTGRKLPNILSIQYIHGHNFSNLKPRIWQRAFIQQ